MISLSSKSLHICTDSGIKKVDMNSTEIFPDRSNKNRSKEMKIIKMWG